ncbi:coiled-coil domain-containing protein [Ceratobasidium sp. AG-Ba]|nr:coiled-coil domain-containing protein [Ceratobasidium sp. AG-Ba]
MSDLTTTNQECASTACEEQKIPEAYGDIHDPVSSPSGVKQPLVNILPYWIREIFMCEDQAEVAALGSGPCTTRFRFHELCLAGHIVRLIDSPGFDGPPSSSKRVLSKLVFYLMNLQHNPRRLSAIILLHPEGHDLESDNLRDNINALKVMVGQSSLPRLKIVVVPSQKQATIDPHAISALQAPNSPFYDAHVGGAEILTLTPQPEDIKKLLANCASLPGQLLRVQSQILNRRIAIGDITEYIDGIFNRGPGRSSLQQTPRPRQRGNHTAGRSMRADPTDVIHERAQQLERALSEQETEIKSLRGQLEQTRLDYASLRSELQLNDNTEPSKLVRSLEILNRSIEDFGRHMAEHIVDQRIPDYTDDHTALKALNISEIKAMFHQKEGGFSLVMSPTGEGMQTEDFFDLAVRSIVCHRIHQDIFLPFHPNLVDSPSNLFIQNLYGAIQKQGRLILLIFFAMTSNSTILEHPTIAFKWRANAFLGLCEDCNPESARKLVQQNIIESLNNIVSKFFDDQATVALKMGLQEELGALVVLAWNWNHTLKGDVVVLGDFQPIVFEHTVPFDNNQMADFEPNRKKAVPSTALCTIGLGLKSFRPKTKGGPWEETVVYKARVATEYIYG